jgi:mevalonate kinase
MKSFNSKILLFGEYSLLVGSSALTIPFSKYSGSFSFSSKLTDTQMLSNQIMKKLSFYLHAHSWDFTFSLDLDSFQYDITKGLFFDSSIPFGYGIGSSGALVAAVFDNYSPASAIVSDRLGLSLLQKDMGLVESFFHGRSSGIDPLSIFIGRPLLIDRDSIRLIHEEEIGKMLRSFYLCDTGFQSTTKELVGIFIQKMKDVSFKNIVEKQLNPSVNACIQSILADNVEDLQKNLKIISKFQFENVKDAIPENINALWKKGIETGDFLFKLCGSGGGGYMLVYSQLKKELLDDMFKMQMLEI